MRVSILLVAATTFAVAQAASLMARADSDADQCAATCAAQAASDHLDAATKCASTDVSDTEVCLCQTPDLLQGVLSCMRTACPGDDATFQKGCDIVTGKSSTTTGAKGAGSALAVPVVALSSVLLAGVAFL